MCLISMRDESFYFDEVNPQAQLEVIKLSDDSEGMKSNSSLGIKEEEDDSIIVN